MFNFVVGNIYNLENLKDEANFIYLARVVLIPYYNQDIITG
jgi:hypothetical protein